VFVCICVDVTVCVHAVRACIAVLGCVLADNMPSRK
jgi:hypothetical protein